MLETGFSLRVDGTGRPFLPRRPSARPPSLERLPALGIVRGVALLDVETTLRESNNPKETEEGKATRTLTFSSCWRSTVVQVKWLNFLLLPPSPLLLLLLLLVLPVFDIGTDTEGEGECGDGDIGNDASREALAEAELNISLMSCCSQDRSSYELTTYKCIGPTIRSNQQLISHASSGTSRKYSRIPALRQDCGISKNDWQCSHKENCRIQST
jgi:hypothetical protein